MDLREHAVYFKWSTYVDLLGARLVSEVIRSFEALIGAPMCFSQDLGIGRRQRPLPPREEVTPLVERCEGGGINVSARFKLFARKPTPGEPQRETLEVVSGGHPYTGRFRVALDARVSGARFEEARFVEAFVSWVRAMTTLTRPFMGHAHDVDDNAIQNISSPALLRSGFGLDVKVVDVLENPGVEVSRGEFRHVVNWLMVWGPEMVEQLGVEVVEGLPVPFELVEPDHALVRLYQRPQEASRPWARGLQKQTRDHLGVRELVAAQGPTLGYWNRRSWKDGGS